MDYRLINPLEEQKLDLEQRTSEAFERRDTRDGRRLNRQLQRVTTTLEDLYKQWTQKA